MWRSVITGFAVLCVFVCTPALEAAVIYDNGLPDLNNYAAASNINCGPNCQQVGDRFVLSSGMNVITDIHWWGGYSTTLLPAQDNFTINIFYFTNGVADQNPFYSNNVGKAPTRNDTGTHQSYMSAEVYVYDLSVAPITLTAGVPYLLSIVQDLPVIPGTARIYWGWSLGTANGVATSYSRTLVDPWSETTPGFGTGTGDLAFYLTGPVRTVPIPASLLLLGPGFVGLVAIRRRFKK